ncbi:MULTISPECIES: S-adenosylmethionine:tRNA ribosyltransferase-isomerase [Streptomyces]|uniref:S-adenosylmethionine:tRNA ribosyltransferase-isomerase n=1 Tax=Streptomyces siderophoricus TaxID=2802281 RepID=A0ABS1MN64_9ACTN|nr:S-adenosylmethionine:tRNA ribosyltransferase-isomerase [Streptomyces sp. 9-7]MBL1089221.1 S-adenosylmethionine:tRNA ribosyltransferase-isomerase [Streptomyces sp. 9-7]
MIAEALRVPAELSARVPAEQRGPGLGRDDVRLLVSRGTREPAHHVFRELPKLLGAGDVLVVNTSRTLPAAVDGRTGDGRGRGEPVVVHFSTRADRWHPAGRAVAGCWAVELRSPDGRGSTLPRPGGPAGTVVRLPGGARLTLEAPVDPGGVRLWWARPSGLRVPELLRRHGRPIRYGYTDRDQPLTAYRTVFAVDSPGAGSAEMPSAARPFTAELVARLVSRGVQFAPISLHTGVASAEAFEPPYPERFAVPAATAWLVNAVRARRRAAPRAAGGRIVAVGTTAVRALESATGADGRVRAAAGWTDLVVTPERGVRAVDGLLTGLHEPTASHLLMLRAVASAAADRTALERAYEAAVARRYLWHEFGDLHLLLPDRVRDSVHDTGDEELDAEPR